MNFLTASLFSRQMLVNFQYKLLFLIYRKIEKVFIKDQLGFIFAFFSIFYDFESKLLRYQIFFLGTNFFCASNNSFEQIQ